jgi:stearoyl-CoA desaturase (delta-9 desaturase)
VLGARSLRPSASGAADVDPVQHETLHRTITGLVTGLPVLALGAAAWRAWDGLLRPSDLLVFAILYVLTGLGVTVGFHRLLTHRSFKTGPWVRGIHDVRCQAAVAPPVRRYREFRGGSRPARSQ